MNELCCDHVFRSVTRAGPHLAPDMLKCTRAINRSAWNAPARSCAPVKLCHRNLYHNSTSGAVWLCVWHSLVLSVAHSPNGVCARRWWRPRLNTCSPSYRQSVVSVCHIMYPERTPSSTTSAWICRMEWTLSTAVRLRLHKNRQKWRWQSSY